MDEAGCPLPGPVPRDADSRDALIVAAAASGSVAKLNWLQARGITCQADGERAKGSMRAAAKSGSLEVVQFLHRLGGDRVLGVETMEAAMESGSWDVAAYLLAAGCPLRGGLPWGPWVRVGHLGDAAAVGWLVEAARLPVEAVVCDVVEPWPARTAEDSRQLLEAVRLCGPLGSANRCLLSCALERAARRGDVDLMRYLHKDLGCELGPILFADAAEGGCEAAIEWLVEAGCPGEDMSWSEAGECYCVAAMGGKLAALSCLRRLGLGVPLSEGLLLQRRRGHLPVPAVQWLYGTGRTCGLAENGAGG